MGVSRWACDPRRRISKNVTPWLVKTSKTVYSHAEKSQKRKLKKTCLQFMLWRWLESKTVKDRHKNSTCDVT